MVLVEGGSGFLIQHRATLFLGMARVPAICPVDLALNPRGWLVVLRLRGSVCGRTVIEIVSAILRPTGGAVGKPGGALLVESLRGFRAMRNRFVYSCRLAVGCAGVTGGARAFRRPGRGCRRVRGLVVDCVVDSVLLSGLVTVFVIVVGSDAFSGSPLEHAERHSAGIVSARAKMCRLCM